MSDKQNNTPANSGGAKPRGFTSKKNLIFIILVAVLTFAVGGAVLVAGVSNSPENRLSRHMRAAERYLAELDYERAVIEYQRALEIEPMNVVAILGLADAYIGLGDKEKAIEVLRDGLERTGDDRIKEKLKELEKLEEPPVPPESEDIPSEAEETESETEERESESEGSESEESESEKGEPVFGSMGTVNICGVDIDIATTTTLLIYNKEKADEKKVEFIEDAYNDMVIYLSSDLADEDMKKIGQLSQLKDLEICFVGLSNVNILAETVAELTNLKGLSLVGNEISDVRPLSGLTNLRSLSIDFDEISDISPLSGLTNLRFLSLYSDEISDISPLSGLTNLRFLSLSSDEISDINPLSGLTNLKFLSLSSDEISDISPLSGLTNLRYLFLSLNSIKISDVSPLSKLTNLTYLSLISYRISDFDIEWLRDQLPNCAINKPNRPNIEIDDLLE